MPHLSRRHGFGCIEDEHGGEEGLLSEVVDNGKISKGSIQKRIKEIKNSEDDADELAVLEQYMALFEKEADVLRKRLKTLRKILKKSANKISTSCRGGDKITNY